MTAQLVTLGAGRHNDQFDTAASRVLGSGQWKRQRIVVILPSAPVMIPCKVALSHWNIMFPPNNGVYRILALGVEVGEAYSQAIDMVLNSDLNEWEYILTIEADNVPPADGVLRLVASMDKHPEFNCIGGLYWTKGEGGVPQIWGDPKDPVLNFRPQVPIPETVQECCGTGMGFNLWRISMFKDKALRRPWFKTIAGAEGVGTQDLYFWSDARKHGHRCAVDTGVRVGHYDVNQDIVW